MNFLKITLFITISFISTYALNNIALLEMAGGNYSDAVSTLDGDYKTQAGVEAQMAEARAYCLAGKIDKCIRN